MFAARTACSTLSALALAAVEAGSPTSTSLSADRTRSRWLFSLLSSARSLSQSSRSSSTSSTPRVLHRHSLRRSSPISSRSRTLRGSPEKRPVEHPVCCALCAHAEQSKPILSILDHRPLAAGGRAEGDRVLPVRLHRNPSAGQIIPFILVLLGNRLVSCIDAVITAKPDVWPILGPRTAR
jgi:hypothetical protein